MSCLIVLSAIALVFRWNSVDQIGELWMPRPDPDFALDELYALLADQPDVDSDGVTVTEMCALWQMGRSLVCRRLRGLIADGKIALCRKRMVDLAGRRTTVPAYRIVKDTSGNQDTE